MSKQTVQQQQWISSGSNPLLLDDSQAVVDKLKSLGHFDEIRKKMSEKLCQNVHMKKYMEELLTGSEVLKNQATMKLTQREVYQKVREEIEEKIVERAGELLWDILTQQQHGIAHQLDEKLFEALRQVHIDRKSSVEQMKSQQMQGTADEKATIYAQIYQKYQKDVDEFQRKCMG
eukprot:TRINITY_DN3109_c0_g1_i2.p3 TRINITY_DN3109_c0_g1~~TRINITY_DN3109_c0_g1_i2.p3  ORF type:complete len:175 (-),score=21.79 TRINITY_DN3109_c0_g1_i2:581-1105(-)